MNTFIRVKKNNNVVKIIDIEYFNGIMRSKYQP